ncbi:hypothetical protein DLM75_19750 [Leptospira stimsonii]|uniref:Uncharacterized protein n=1 Tax=Leptospira stimsonii TaxID=2202203 RepID=A0A396YV27_9LEPT|nr:hypothetical protein DLM75_19750 [Leptospira stimsonii]
MLAIFVKWKCRSDLFLKRKRPTSRPGHNDWILGPFFSLANVSSNGSDGSSPILQREYGKKTI